jgi:hypothetical protein
MKCGNKFQSKCIICNKLVEPNKGIIKYERPAWSNSLAVRRGNWKVQHKFVNDCKK